MQGPGPLEPCGSPEQLVSPLAEEPLRQVRGSEHAARHRSAIPSALGAPNRLARLTSSAASSAARSRSPSWSCARAARERQS